MQDRQQFIDQAAIAAMAAQLAHPSHPPFDETLAAKAYDYAMAMAKEREKRFPNWAPAAPANRQNRSIP